MVYTVVVIRAARADDLAHLQQLERAAGAAFHAVGMSAVADDPPPSFEVLDGYRQGGRAFVATDAADRPVAYLLVDVVDAAAHVHQVSVHPRHARRRLGSALLDRAATWAAERHLQTVTLTSFTDVPWNAPYYAQLGFRVLAEHELTVGLRRIGQHEAALGLDRWPRVAMARAVLPGPEEDRAGTSQ